MQDWTCQLITTEFEIDSVGNHKSKEIKVEIPIIEIQDVYQSEFYNASQQGLKPTLRLLISNLNYNDEEELVYMDKHYSIIRVDRVDNETIALVCEKRVGLNAKSTNKQLSQ